jgi:hypothetical protein
VLQNPNDTAVSATRKKGAAITGPAQHHGDDDDDEARKVILRKRNAFYARRKYERKKIEIDGMQCQRRQLENMQERLQQENHRLEDLVQQAKPIVDKIDPQGTGQATVALPSLPTGQASSQSQDQLTSKAISASHSASNQQVHTTESMPTSSLLAPSNVPSGIISSRRALVEEAIRRLRQMSTPSRH